MLSTLGLGGDVGGGACGGGGGVFGLFMVCLQSLRVVTSAVLAAPEVEGKNLQCSPVEPANHG